MVLPPFGTPWILNGPKRRSEAQAHEARILHLYMAVRKGLVVLP